MIRVSCATLCRIRHPDGRLLLGLNKNRLQHGERVLTPYGGASTFDDAEPLRALGARLEREDDQDLRFFIDQSELPRFEAWFRARTGRETDPFRELYEELVSEEELLPPFEAADLNAEYVGLVTAESETTRGVVQGALTRYYLEVFEVALADRLWSDLLPRLDEANTRARLVTIAEIEAGQTTDGVAIAPTAGYLLQADARGADRTMGDEPGR